MGCGALWLLLLGAGYKYSYLLTYLLHITIYLFQTRKVLTTHKHTHKNTETRKASNPRGVEKDAFAKPPTLS